MRVRRAVGTAALCAYQSSCFIAESITREPLKTDNTSSTMLLACQRNGPKTLWAPNVETSPKPTCKVIALSEHSLSHYLSIPWASCTLSHYLSIPWASCISSCRTSHLLAALLGLSSSAACRDPACSS
ncbi:hypothetical protein PF010_g25791 [Phytophthora fragariae]|uniref:Uncharacterized protein n=1 Tax=Phytophthora fragariae TaxID=53985 RepID=A0A6A3R197_9STRA|nr:hypothetical protein PF003_g14555 [Phytophthora fragariae]KAE9071653.1 hypothetical protein PF010_g25791 [Phytophthora fragariae]KAE9087799.1 hypothetical protein PF006_g25723 [Phytophthora fragariae]